MTTTSFKEIRLPQAKLKKKLEVRTALIGIGPALKAGIVWFSLSLVGIT